MYFAGLNYFVLGYSLTEYRFKRTTHIISTYLLIWNFNDYTNYDVTDNPLKYYNDIDTHY